MTPVNIKEIVTPVEGQYKTEIVRFDIDRKWYQFWKPKVVTHKHIWIFGEQINRHFIKDADHNWYEGDCTLCS